MNSSVILFARNLPFGSVYGQSLTALMVFGVESQLEAHDLNYFCYGKKIVDS